MNTTDIQRSEDAKFLLDRTKFYILLTLQILAILLSLLIFVFFLTRRTQLKTVQNQGLLVLLSVIFFQLTVDMPMPIHFYYHGQVTIATPSFCTWWTYIEFTCNLMSELVMATISIQRHILIFQVNFFNNRFYRYLLHRLPFAICLLYPFVVYGFFFSLYTCDGTQWDYTSNACGFVPCFYARKTVLSVYDLLGHNLSPVIIIVLANVALIIRVIYEKRRRNQSVTWKRHRRMTLQLLAISSVYFISWLPVITIIVPQQLGNTNFLIQFAIDYGNDMVYGIPLLTPWVCFGLLSECRNWIRNFCIRKRIIQNSIRPMP